MKGIHRWIHILKGPLNTDLLFTFMQPKQTVKQTAVLTMTALHACDASLMRDMCCSLLTHILSSDLDVRFALQWSLLLYIAEDT